MNNAIIFCLCLHDGLLNKVKELNYMPVGLGENNFSKEWLRDFSGDNISKKNMYYGEHSFHYWFWKNYLDKLDSKWIGFCQYRKFWSLEQIDPNKINFEKLPNQVLKDIPENSKVMGYPAKDLKKFIKENK